LVAVIRSIALPSGAAATQTFGNPLPMNANSHRRAAGAALAVTICLLSLPGVSAMAQEPPRTAPPPVGQMPGRTPPSPPPIDKAPPPGGAANPSAALSRRDYRSLLVLIIAQRSVVSPIQF